MIDAAAVAVGAHEVLDVERRLAEERIGALIFEHQQCALDGTDRGSGDVAVHLLQLRRVFRDQPENGAQVLEVEQCQPLLVGDPERDVEHALLRVVELQEPRQQQRTHFGHRGADRMTLFAEHVPEHHGELVGLVRQAHAFGALDKGRFHLAGLADAGKVALDVGGKNRNAVGGEAFRQHLQGHGLAGAGRAGDEPMAIAEMEVQHLEFGALADDNAVVRQRGSLGDRRLAPAWLGRFRLFLGHGLLRFRGLGHQFAPYTAFGLASRR